MHTALGDILHTDQTCAVPGHKVSGSLGLVREAIQFVEERGLRLSVISLDQEIIFHRVSQEHMMAILDCFWLQNKFVVMCWLHVSDIEGFALVNGHLSGAFLITSGVRQGCPMPPVLFVPLE